MRSHRGFSLIEVLVALLVLAIGVLGILALQLHTLRITRDIAAQSLALQLAADIAETVRGGADSPEMLEAFEHFDYIASANVGGSTGDNIDGNAVGAGDGATCYGADSSCTPAQLAAFEMRDWQARIRQLPGGRVRICRDDAPWNGTQHSIRWDCASTSNTNRTLAPLWIKAGWHGTASKFAMSSAMPSAPPAATPLAPQLLIPLVIFSH